MPRSRITTGFHRLGIVLATPVLIVALVVAWKDPSGPLKDKIPEGALAYAFGDNELDIAARRMLAVQRASGLNLPKDMMLVGLPGETAILNDVEWKKFKLWNGREIGIATKEQKKLDTIARVFLLNEMRTQHQYDEKDSIEIDAVPVKFLNHFDQFRPASSPWLVKSHDWVWPLVLFSLAVAIYIVMWALAWVITGFSRANN